MRGFSAKEWCSHSMRRSTRRHSTRAKSRRGSGNTSAPRFRRDGTQGVDVLATGRTTLSRDGSSVFVHIPGLQPTMQLEVAHEFSLKGQRAGRRTVYFSATELLPAPWVELGFDPPELDESEVAQHAPQDGGEPTAERGKEVALRFGCIACHSLDGNQEGHSGPSWKGVFGSERRFTDGTTRVADAAYLREAILDPAKTIVEGYDPGMASYAGVLSDEELESVILYIESLR
jgi:cytochrome c2